MTGALNQRLRPLGHAIMASNPHSGYDILQKLVRKLYVLGGKSEVIILVSTGHIALVENRYQFIRMFSLLNLKIKSVKKI